MRVADRDQDMLFHADPSRGELLSAEQHVEGKDEVFDEGDDDLLDSMDSPDSNLSALIKDPYSKKKQMLTPQQYRVITVGEEGLLKDGQMI